jgi:predicted permease
MSFIQDLRFACRLLVKQRWFSAVAVLALTLGIGVNATVFTLVNAVLIRGLPFKDSHQLYVLSTRMQNGNAGVSHADLADWRSQTKSFTGLAAFTQGPINLADDQGLPEQLRGGYLTANAFQVLAQQPLLGRDFMPDADTRGAEMTVILGHSVWKNRYAGDPNVLGKPIRVNGQPATVIGVMPDKMQFPSNAELWLPMIPTNEQAERRNNRFMSVFGRLRAGTSIEEAQTEMNGIAGRLASQYPDTNKEAVGVLIQTFNERFNGGPIRAVFLSLMGAVCFVLLIACANVANLLLSRSADRAREIAVRIAMGASRWRVVRQLLIESILLGLLGGVFGLLLAYVGVRIFDAATQNVGKPYWIDFRIDLVVIAYLAGICVLTGILFGFAPALQVSKTNVNEILKEGGRGAAGGRRARIMSGTMVVVELALTIVLLTGAGLMIRNFLQLYRVDIGIQPDHLMAMPMRLPDRKYQTPEQRRAFYDRLSPKLGAIAGVDSAALTTSVPPQGAGRRGFEIEGRPVRNPNDEPPAVSTVIISPAFFETVGVQLRRGRTFNETDGLPGSEAVIINERWAREQFPNEDPIGRRIRFVTRNPPANQPPPVWRAIVGISPSIRHSNPQDAEPPGVAYIPFRQEPPFGLQLLVRSSMEPGTVMNAVRREVQALDQDQPVFNIQTLEQMLAQQRWPFRVFGSLFAILAFIALALAAVGLYAVMAYSVTQRRQEIGVRMALGAGGKQVSWLILRRGLIQLAIGLTIGLCGSYFASQALSSLMVGGLAARDPLTFVAISVLLSCIAISACLIPARRATRVDPLLALRNE